MHAGPFAGQENVDESNPSGPARLMPDNPNDRMGRFGMDGPKSRSEKVFQNGSLKVLNNIRKDQVCIYVYQFNYLSHTSI